MTSHLSFFLATSAFVGLATTDLNINSDHANLEAPIAFVRPATSLLGCFSVAEPS